VIERAIGERQGSHGVREVFAEGILTAGKGDHEWIVVDAGGAQSETGEAPGKMPCATAHVKQALVMPRLQQTRD